MVRPDCPACSDNFTVAKVSALYQTVTSGGDRASIGNLARDEILRVFPPPPDPRPVGRYLLIAAAAGLTVSVLSGLTFMWLFIALCIGLVTEMMNCWEYLQERDDYQLVLSRWKAAYFCTTHTLVFFRGEARTYSPARFARLIEQGPVRPEAPVRARPERYRARRVVAAVRHG